jgi:hypothetical protein
MALARIISRSPQCSRELALDLLTRGYTVEIVSPDAIPDNFADLELRVEADASNDLTANVAVHDGGHSTSLDFVHHLRAPMVDFVRRPQDTSEAAYFPESPVSFNAEQSLFDEIELPRKTPEQVLPPATPPLLLLPDPNEGARLITPPEPGLPPAKESEEEHVRTGITIIFHRSRSKPKHMLKPRPANASSRWFLRTAVGFAVVVVLAVVLGRGVSRDVGASSARSAPTQSPRIAPAEEASAFPVAESPRTAAAIAGTPASGPQEKRTEVSLKAASPELQSSPSRFSIPSLRKTDDLRTPNAAVYRDKPIAQAAKSKSNRHHNGRRRHYDDMVAADTVTYLDRTTTLRNRMR